MRKTILFMSLFAMPILTNAYSYYGDYSTSKSSPKEIIITIILIVWVILNIILFFKIWGMTNDVKHMRTIYEKKQVKYNLNNVVANYYIKKDLYGQNTANMYLKEIVETEYKSLGNQFLKKDIEGLTQKLQVQIGIALTDAGIELPSLTEYLSYLTSIYGKFLPGTKVKLKGRTEVCEVCNVADNGKIIVKTYAGYKFSYDRNELEVVELEAE